MTKEELARELHRLDSKLGNEPAYWESLDEFVQGIFLRIARVLLDNYRIIPKSVKCIEGNLNFREGDKFLYPCIGEKIFDDIVSENEGKYARLFIEEEKCE